MRYTREAAAEIERLAEYYEAAGRPEAVRNLRMSLIEAEHIIAADPTGGLAAPRPYPSLRQPGRLWIKVGAYWVAYRHADPLTIVGAFYERADIPGRV